MHSKTEAKEIVQKILPQIFAFARYQYINEYTVPSPFHQNNPTRLKLKQSNKKWNDGVPQ